MAISKEEAVLIEKARMGSESDFEALILSCQGKAYSMAYRYFNNPEDAMDALQESFLKIYRSLGTFKGESSFQTWVYRIVANTCCDMLRKKKARITTESLVKMDGEDEYTLEIMDESMGPEERAIHQEMTGYILHCLEKLPLEQKEIIVLRDIQGFSYEDIAEILNINPGTVKSRISRARVKLREIYVGGGEPD
ncbi:MAG: sigma-70 family RNA polymerase sigma factor [Anaerovoracaceae bacterium]|jgi:RNA polymerase sigma-70 factor (ECF subfamily)